MRRSFWIIGFLLFMCSGLRAADFEVYPSHPRLFFRDSAWGEHGLTVDVVKARAARPEARPVLEKLNRSLPDLALKSLVMGDREAAREAIRLLQQPIERDATTTDGELVGLFSLALDWLWNDPEFSDSAKAKAVANLADGAEYLIGCLGSGAHIFHTRMYGWAMGVGLAGLALHGHHPQADRYASFARDYFQDKLFPARRLQDGSVHNGFGYGRKYTEWLTGHFISAWYSATGENFWKQIESQGDWARKETLFMIYGRYPNRSYLRFGDSYSILSDAYSFRAAAERSQAYGDPVGQGFLRLMWEQNQGRVTEQPTAYTYFVFYDPEAPAVSPSSLPTRRLFSRDGTGMLVWKSDWSDGGTTVFFKCGNYFGDHGHFDQGHLDVYRRAPLLLDSGSYLTFDGPFRMEYWHLSVAHNTVLILDPAVPGDTGVQRAFHSQGDSTMAMYMADTLAETGSILDYQDQPGLAYVAGDMTAAYPADRAARVTRELAFLDNRWLVVLDRVQTARAGLEPHVLWHCAAVPEMQTAKGGFSVRRDGARVIVNTLLPKEANQNWVEGFVAGGKKIEPTGHQKPLPDMGAGRVEVAPAGAGSRDFLFLHVLDIADDSDAPVEYSVKQGKDKIQVQVGVRSVAFRVDRCGLVR